MSSPQQISDHMHSVFSSIGGMIAISVIAARQNARTQEAYREAHAAMCHAAARGATAAVLSSTAARLRSRLEEADLEMGFLRDELADADDEIQKLRADLAAVCGLVTEIRAGRAA